MIRSWPITSREEWLERRRSNLNASEVAALFGPDVHPNLTPYKLYLSKTGQLPAEEETPAMRRGKKFEPVVIAILEEEHPDWRLKQAVGYLWDDETRLGATPDCYAERPDIYGRGTIQIKTVGQFAFERKWHDEDGVVRVPTWIAVQAMLEAYLTGSTWAAVAAMKLGDGGIDIVFIEIPLKPALIHRLEDLTLDFWTRVAENRPYDPDYGRDRKLILDLYKNGDGSTIDLTDDEHFHRVIERRMELNEIEAEGEKARIERQEVDAGIIRRLGNASAARLGETIVRVSIVKKKAYSVKATQYPLVKVRRFKDE